jgi:NAD(P)-dependent dehydrogenase (short-subunit alcohol dehydrogenase family)
VSCSHRKTNLIPENRRAIFVETDVAVWDSVLSLFETTLRHFNTLDAVYANAGVNFADNLLEDEFDATTGRLKEPTLKNVQINLHGAFYTTKAAMHFFGKEPGKKHQLVLTGSAARYVGLQPHHSSGYSRIIRSQRRE